MRTSTDRFSIGNLIKRNENDLLYVCNRFTYESTKDLYFVDVLIDGSKAFYKNGGASERLAHHDAIIAHYEAQIKAVSYSKNQMHRQWFNVMVPDDCYA